MMSASTDYGQEDDYDIADFESKGSKKAPSGYATKGTVKRGAMADMLCHCGAVYQAMEADLKRGHGYSCSKSCAATRRDYGNWRAKRIEV